MAGTAGLVFPGLRSPARIGVRPDGCPAPAAGAGSGPAPAGSAVLSSVRPGAFSPGLYHWKRQAEAVHAPDPGAWRGVLSAHPPEAWAAFGRFPGLTSPADLLHCPFPPGFSGKNREKNSFFCQKSLSIFGWMVYNKLSDIRLRQERVFWGGAV